MQEKIKNLKDHPLNRVLETIENYDSNNKNNVRDKSLELKMRAKDLAYVYFMLLSIKYEKFGYLLRKDPSMKINNVGEKIVEHNIIINICKREGVLMIIKEKKTDGKGSIYRLVFEKDSNTIEYMYPAIPVVVNNGWVVGSLILQKKHHIIVRRYTSEILKAEYNINEQSYVKQNVMGTEIFSSVIPGQFHDLTISDGESMIYIKNNMTTQHLIVSREPIPSTYSGCMSPKDRLFVGEKRRRASSNHDDDNHYRKHKKI